jgi:hypothetical protein
MSGPRLDQKSCQTPAHLPNLITHTNPSPYIAKIIGTLVMVNSVELNKSRTSSQNIEYIRDAS